MNAITTNDAASMALFKAAYPETNFKKVDLRAFRGPMSLNSYWDSGYRDYYRFVRMADNSPFASVPQNGTPFDGKNLELSELPSGFALCVRHYAGVRQYGSIYLNEADLVPLLPAPVELPWVEKAVLSISAALKSFARREQAHKVGLSDAEWESGKAGLVTRKLLNAAGAVTIDGQNLVRSWYQYGASQAFDRLAKEGGRECYENPAPGKSPWDYRY